MSYSKIKHVEAAQKHLAQNRVPQAVHEYQQILKHEPSDQVTLMTVGDLYVRQGETFQAIDYFARLAQIFVRDGFLTKAIAIYKKIAKLAPEEMKPLERLAELYVQQGVLSEARPIFLQLAEGHLKAGRREPAAALLRKLLEAEPDNLRVQLRLAEVQIAMGQKNDAAQTFLVCAERQLLHHDPDEAVKLVARSMELAPDNAAAILLKARALSASSKFAEAMVVLESLPELDTGNEAAAELIKIYLQENLADRAISLTQKITKKNPKNYSLAAKTSVKILESEKPEAALALLGAMRKAMTENGDSEQLAQLLHTAATRLPGRLEPHEWLVELFTQINDAFHLPEAMAQLGQAAAAAGKYDRARQIYEQLIERSPEDQNIRRNLEQVRAHLGLDPLADPEEATVPAAEKAAPPVKFEEPALDAETQQFVSLALTDVDLFSSYGLTPKAVDLLEKVLERAPQYTPALEKMLDLYLGEGNNKRTAELAERLAVIHGERGDTINAERYEELHRRFQRLAAQEPETPATPAEFSLPISSPTEHEFAHAAPLPSEAAEKIANLIASTGRREEKQNDPEATQELVHEVDLSDEWASISHQQGAQASSTPTLEDAAPSRVIEPRVSEPTFVEANTSSFAIEDEAPLPPAISVPQHEADERVLQAHAEHIETDEPAEYELELVEPAANNASNVAPFRTKESGDATLSDLASEVGDVLDKALTEGKSAASNGAGHQQVIQDAPANADEKTADVASYPVPDVPLVEASAPGGPLSEIFAEFRDALDELQADEDPETHYNLGIAYREMGLLEEAISEFQKVVQAHDHGKPFRYVMQCCTLLALGFMEKGQPEIACFWYERALKTPNLDQEAILALQYDLGVSQDLAGHAKDALKSFQHVYAMNIDYRDVAERIVALRQR